MNLAEWLIRTAERKGGAAALLNGAECVADYAAFATHAMAIAASMRERFGVRAGDRVAIFTANCPEYLEAFYGVWCAGAAVVPINYKLHPREAAWIVGDAEAKAVFSDDASGDALAAALGSSAPPIVSVESADFAAMRNGEPLGRVISRERNDLAWLFYTSGTTGKPKGVMLSHGNLQAAALSYFADVDEVFESDAALYAAPLSHGAGLYNLMHVLRGARHVVPPSRGFDEREVLELSAELGGVHMFAAPTMVRRLVDRAKASGATGEGIRTIVYGGGPMYVADIEDAVSVMGPRFVQIYGQGESPMTITALQRELVADRSHPRWRERLGSVGRAHSVVEVKVVGDDGTAAAVGETGEILVRGAPVMLGYWRNPEATEDALVGGWLHTGDIGAMDEDGFLTLKDRSKDLIISGGANIYPREVEEVLLAHPGVHEASVIGRSDAEWGEIVVAYVVGDADVGELDRLCTDRIARFKRPRDYVRVETLPKNSYGKVLKTELRALDAAKDDGLEAGAKPDIEALN
jgi:long-chain acyl-CoA synthetase